jgi:hypothetical protein
MGIERDPARAAPSVPEERAKAVDEFRPSGSISVSRIDQQTGANGLALRSRGRSALEKDYAGQCSHRWRVSSKVSPVLPLLS